MSRSETLSQFFGGYFHQDWLMDASDWKGVIASFANEATREELIQVVTDVKALLVAESSEADIQRVLTEELGCYYTPRPDLGGPTFRQWLSDVSAELSRLIAQQSIQPDRREDAAPG